MEFTIQPRPTSRSEGHGKYGDLMEALLALPANESICVVGVTRADVLRVYNAIVGRLRGCRHITQIPKRLRTRMDGNTLYMWLVDADENARPVSARFQQVK